MPELAQECDTVTVPAAFVSLTGGVDDDVSPQSMIAVWVSCVPASVKLVASVVALPGETGEVAVSAVITGATFENVTFAVEVNGGWNGSVTLIVAVRRASSLHTTVGFAVLVLLGVQTVPGFALVVVNVHEMTTGSPSGSVAVPCSVIGVPSGAAYGPPAFAIGAPSCTVRMRTSSMPGLPFCVF